MKKEQTNKKDKNTTFEVAICDLKTVDIESMIHVIRGQQVMLDYDLAMLYNVENKRLKEQVNRNIQRFPEDFMFKLTPEEFDCLRSQIATSNGRGGTRYLPFAFTRNGVAMLSSVLKSDIAIGVNIRIMRAFTAIPEIANHNSHVIQRIFNIEQHQLEIDKKIETIIDKIEDFSPKPSSEQIFPTGCVWDAWNFVSNLIRQAKTRIVLIDNYVDDRVISLLTKRAAGVSAIIYTRYQEQFLTDLEKHNQQYERIEFIQLSHRNHDRFLIIDDAVYLLGASVKDMGVGMCAITKMTTTPEVILSLL